MTHDVVIAGGGPVGLMLACELRLAGVSVLVLERAADPHTMLKRPPFGIRGLSVPTLEAFDRRGLLDDLAAPPRGATPHASSPKRRHAGHFAGIPFDPEAIDTSRWPYRLPGPADTNRAADMQQIETALARRALSSGVDIFRGRAVTAVAQTEAGVTVQAGDRAFAAKWLVGCDGGRSLVRKVGAFDLVGTEPEFTGYFVQAEMADPDVLRMGRTYTPTGLYFQLAPGAIAMVEFDGGAFHRSAPVTLEHVQAVLRRVSCTEVTITALHVASTWTDRAQQATGYRDGRILLAGDAAHIHSPLGGQGLNLGLGDAMNLGWKLAAVIQGRAPDALLDSYAGERHPIGEAILNWSRAQVTLMRPSRSSRALEAIVRDLVATRDGATYFAERVWGVAQRYDLGGRHPLVGRRAPNFALTDGTTLATLLRTGQALLLDFDVAAPLRSLAARWGEPLRYIAGDAEDRLGLRAVLVRPDGYVAWATDDAPDIAEAEAAATRWLGPPR